MAKTRKNIITGAQSVISLGAYVENAGAGSLTEVGYTKGDVSQETSFEQLEITSEQILGRHGAAKTGVAYKFKFVIQEMSIENLRQALLLLAAQKTGIAPNEVLAVVDPQVEIYYQATIAGPAVKGATGVQGTRTITIWRGGIESIDPIAMGKSTEQLVGVTLNAFYDDTIATPLTNGNFFKYVDSGVA